MFKLTRNNSDNAPPAVNRALIVLGNRKSEVESEVNRGKKRDQYWLTLLLHVSGRFLLSISSQYFFTVFLHSISLQYFFTVFLHSISQYWLKHCYCMFRADFSSNLTFDNKESSILLDTD